MPSLGPLEILVILVVALLVFGPNKLPEIARQTGKAMSEFRRVQHHLRRELDDAVHSVMNDDSPGNDGTAPADSVDAALDVNVTETPASAVDPPPSEAPALEPPALETPAAGTAPDVSDTEGLSFEPAEPDTR